MIERSDDTYKPMPLRIESVSEENPLIRTINLSFVNKNDENNFKFKPGQFALFSLPGIGESTFSMSSSHKKRDIIEISIRNVGNTTNAMCNLKKGDMMGVRGPYGNGYPLEEIEGKDIILVAGGIGFPPIASVMEHITKNRSKYGKVWLLYGVATKEDLIYEDKMRRWGKEKDIEILISLDKKCKGWTGCVGKVTDLFRKIKIEDANKTVGLSCGPPIMMKFVTESFKKLGINEGDIFLSLERLMQCGIGKCGHCNIGDKYVCQDGPVFNYSEIKDMAEHAW